LAAVGAVLWDHGVGEFRFGRNLGNGANVHLPGNRETLLGEPARFLDAGGGISIFEERRKTILTALKPTILLAMFNTPQLEGVAKEVEDTIVRIMKEAASG